MTEELVDMPEVPDVPDDDEDEEGEELEESEGGGFVLPGFLAPVAKILAPVGAILAPVGAVLAPVGAILGKVAAPLAPVVGRVPVVARVGVGSGLGVLVVVLLVSRLLGGGPNPAGPTAAEAHAEAELHELELILTPKPTATPRPPTPTPTPIAWEQTESGWVGYGYSGPSRGEMMKPSRLLLFDDARSAFTILTRFTVLTASGPNAPQWGVLLTYADEANNLVLQSVTDGKRRPSFNVTWAEKGNGGTIGDPVFASELDYWGRDTHELRVAVAGDRIKAWMDGNVLATWQNRDHLGLLSLPRKGLFVWFGAKMRFESFDVLD